MQLYVANCTKQDHDFTYRIPEEAGVKKQKIPAGTQIPVFAKGLNKMQIDSVVEHHAKYGLVSFDEIDRTRPFVGLCYAVDRPIPINSILKAMEHNDGVLTKLGQQIRKDAAVATNAAIVDGTDANLRSLEMSVVEEESPNGAPEGRKLLAEGVRVEPDPADAGKPKTRKKR